MKITRESAALVITDPQNDFLSPDGVAWELVGKSVQENGTVEHIEQLLASAKQTGTPVFVSPHYSRTTTSGCSAAHWSGRCTRSRCSIVPGRSRSTG
jgi:nicotinamidase-related amidase